MRKKICNVIILGITLGMVLWLGCVSAIRTAEKGAESPAQAFLLRFPHAKIQAEFEYSNQHCVLGSDRTGPSVVFTEKKADDLYYITDVLKRELLSVDQNNSGNQVVVLFRNPDSQSEEQDEIVVTWKYGNNITPQDTNHAEYHIITMLNDMASITLDIGVDRGEWYAITDIDQPGFMITQG